MGFFDVPSFTPAPPVQQPDPPWPVWMKPEVVLPGVVAGEQLLASAERARTWTRVRCRRPGWSRVTRSCSGPGGRGRSPAPSRHTVLDLVAATAGAVDFRLWVASSRHRWDAYGDRLPANLGRGKSQRRVVAGGTKLAGWAHFQNDL